MTPMADFLATTAAAHPDVPALDDGERSWSYRELDARVSAAAERLRAAGVAGQPVALLADEEGGAVRAEGRVLVAAGAERAVRQLPRS